MESIMPDTLPVQHTITPSKNILRLPKVIQKTGKCRASIYADIRKGLFPKPISLGERSVGWLESEVDEWIDTRIALRG
jgi:prophage regulatory protein